MELKSSLEDGWLTVFYLRGEIDANTAPEFRDALTKTLAAGRQWLVVNLLETQYMDSVALGILLGGAKQANQQGGMLAVVCDRPNLIKIFEISGTKELLNVQTSPAEACSLLASKRDVGAYQPDGGGQNGC